jgi:predicted component of type VI protein secretion system
MATTPAADTSALEGELAEARTQLRALQTRLDARTKEEERLQGRLQEMADRMALLLQQNSLGGSGSGSGGEGREPGRAAEVAAMLPSVSPATRELILIKERNRLSDYADRAIATGSREALQSLVEAMLDPEMKQLVHAAQAEFKRVQAYYDMGIGIDPGYTLPVQELFKDAGMTREADLTPAQLHGLLTDLKQPWEARLRAAFLLRSSDEADTTERLLKALKEDPMLDVAKQAQITFENRVGRKFRLFDIPAIEAWWQAQGKR